MQFNSVAYNYILIFYFGFNCIDGMKEEEEDEGKGS